MSWTITVDRGTCMGSGICAGSRPDVFRLAGTASEPVVDRIEPDEDVLDLADTCPAAAITVRDEAGTELGPRP
ncbi:ferredoxin [Actinokineospora enzanensis]|uniref:ferredoxin n=1 Tax=Actinokineospora enzanensis TaxID=155975 RepID=UPI00037FDE65|nr:ferredoxin [Actinokineospora enzanensis]